MSRPAASPDIAELEAAAALTRLPEHGLGGRRKRRPERHDEILSAAVQLFHAKGYHGTSVEDIAEAVGVSATAIYRHFHNKQEILDTATLWVGEQLAQQLSAVDDTLPAAERLDQLVENLVRTAVTLPNFIALLTRELHSLSAPARAVSRERRAEYITGFCSTLREVVDLTPAEADLRAHLVIALVCSVTTYHKTGLKRIASDVKSAAMAALLSA